MAKAWEDSVTEMHAAPRVRDWRKRMSDNIAYALLVYTALQIFMTMGALHGKGGSILPYFALVVLVVQLSLTDAELRAWGWRIPFLLSVFLLAISVWIRLQLEESPAFQKLKDEGAGVTAKITEFAAAAEKSAKATKDAADGTKQLGDESSKASGLFAAVSDNLGKIALAAGAARPAAAEPARLPAAARAARGPGRAAHGRRGRSRGLRPRLRVAGGRDPAATLDRCPPPARRCPPRPAQHPGRPTGEPGPGDPAPPRSDRPPGAARCGLIALHRPPCRPRPWVARPPHRPQR